MGRGRYGRLRGFGSGVGEQDPVVVVPTQPALHGYNE